MFDPCLFGSGKNVSPTLLWTWLTVMSTHYKLGAIQVQASWVWQTCLTHIYLGLTNMSDPCYFGLG
jgi:hypothetical protein